MSPPASSGTRVSKIPTRSLLSSPPCARPIEELPLNKPEEPAVPDSRGHFGPYGGVFVAETLVHALEELRAVYESCRADPAFVAEFEYDLKHYVGRPSPVYHAKRW